MDTRITLASLLAASLLGNVLLVADGTTYVAQVVEPVAADTVELKTADAGVLKAEVLEAEAKDTVTCEMGGASNYPNRCYCRDNVTAGWLTDASVCKYMVQVLDGKVYTRDVIKVIEGGAIEAVK